MDQMWTRELVLAHWHSPELAECFFKCDNSDCKETTVASSDDTRSFSAANSASTGSDSFECGGLSTTEEEEESGGGGDGFGWAGILTAGGGGAFNLDGTDAGRRGGGGVDCGLAAGIEGFSAPIFFS